ncbi:AAA ATPase forming ring-shaped complexes [Striga asiatica]|uniref:AAA ATPase forming ring-shaped complexes n=1 Tax=Striga asiatica TaxID=4170 RepID=A0A5A7PIH8_STRAF|nr:AAA ATPase forming ring-shaped complexes [Striga asiatica]
MEPDFETDPSFTRLNRFVGAHYLLAFINQGDTTNCWAHVVQAVIDRERAWKEHTFPRLRFIGSLVDDLPWVGPKVVVLSISQRARYVPSTVELVFHLYNFYMTRGIPFPTRLLMLHPNFRGGSVFYALLYASIHGVRDEPYFHKRILYLATKSITGVLNASLEMAQFWDNLDMNII